MALFDENDVVSLPTRDFFSGGVGGLGVPEAVAMGVRFGIALALRYPEYAQAYVQMTVMMESNGMPVGGEEDTFNSFIRAVPVTAVTEKED
ncbi:hypothetical protein LCGC14_1010980 [marine sediment metagenome]|uniref:Uncharacterized protein n=1 Tax=marine sediment metagenome TaxID=412755 RepID=A0A0F9QIH7_9ZZZZ